MAKSIPCPNPSCGNQFSEAEIQSASMLKCPRCGFGFQLRAQTPAPARSNPKPPASATLPSASNLPAAKFSSPPPAAMPVPPARASVPPMAAPPLAIPRPPTAPTPGETAPPLASTGPKSSEPSPAVGLNFDDEGILVRRQPLPRTSSKSNWIMMGGGLLLLAGIIVGGVIGAKNLHLGGGPPPEEAPLANVDSFYVNARNLKNADEKAFRLLLPQNLWAMDKEVRAKLGAHAAWSHKKEDFWFAVYVKDFGLVRPRDAELLDAGIDKLEKAYGENLELAAKQELTSFNNLPAVRLEFKGQIGSVVTRGEFMALAHHGFGYWIFLGAPTLEEARNHWNDLQTETTGLKLVTDRKGWREQPAKMVVFRGESGALTLTAPEGVWAKEEVKEVDERGELLLSGRYRGGEKDNRKNASVLVTTLDVKGVLKEAMKAAREFYETKKKEDNKGVNYQFGPAEEGQEEGFEEEFANKKGRILELKISIGDEPKRYVLLALAAGQPFLVQCDCTWDSRQIWRQDFLELVRSLRAKKGE